MEKDKLNKLAFILLLITTISSLTGFIIWAIDFFNGLALNIEYFDNLTEEYKITWFVKYSFLTFFMFVSFVCSLVLLILLSPRLFRHSTWANLSEEWAKNKAERAAKKQARSDEEKRKQIAELEKKLDDLKKD